MALTADALRASLAEVPDNVEGDIIARGTPVATRLCAFLEAHRAGSAIVEVYSWAFNVEFVLKSGEYWAIECLSPNDFRMYPGFVRGDTVTWANVWVRGTNMSLDELVKDVNGVAFRMTKEEPENA